jgi:hypothetical protein
VPAAALEIETVKETIASNQNAQLLNFINISLLNNKLLKTSL